MDKVSTKKVVQVQDDDVEKSQDEETCAQLEDETQDTLNKAPGGQRQRNSKRRIRRLICQELYRRKNRRKKEELVVALAGKPLKKDEAIDALTEDPVVVSELTRKKDVSVALTGKPLNKEEIVVLAGKPLKKEKTCLLQ